MQNELNVLCIYSQVGLAAFRGNILFHSILSLRVNEEGSVRSVAQETKESFNGDIPHLDVENAIETARDREKVEQT